MDDLFEVEEGERHGNIVTDVDLGVERQNGSKIIILFQEVR